MTERKLGHERLKYVTMYTHAATIEIFIVEKRKINKYGRCGRDSDWQERHFKGINPL